MIYLTGPDLVFDMDDVLVPFAEYVCEMMNKIGEFSTTSNYLEYRFSNYHSVDHKTFTRMIIESNLYANIPAYSGAIDTLNALCRQGFNIHLVTARDSRTNAVKNTKEWIDTNKVPFSSLTIMGGKENNLKSFYYKDIGASILVDDALHNIFDAIEHAPNVKPFVVTRPWNVNNERVNALIAEGRVIRINSVSEVVGMIALA